MKAKTIGFFGGLCLLFNAVTGPGIPYTPRMFGIEGSGAFLSILSFIIFATLSGFSVLLIIEAMQSIPGNKHFQVIC
jgi:amino acid permease